MKQETHYLISDAARKVAVESHVLRYWEEELKLPIKRNELGHRYYTEDDILRFQEVKALKEQGLQLKAIRMILRNGKLEPFAGKEIAARTKVWEKDSAQETEEQREKAQLWEKEQMREKAQLPGKEQFTGKESSHVLMVNSNEIMSVSRNEAAVSESKEVKSLRLQQLLQQMIAEAVRTNNQELCDDIKETMLKELDYQFRLQEEHEEERLKAQIERDDRYYQKIDELLRVRNKKVRPGKEMPDAAVKESNIFKEPKRENKTGLFKKTGKA